jgi:hypothetical protein
MEKIDAHRVLYRFIKHQIPINTFEQWLYNQTELEALFGEKEYLEFISRNYRNKFSFHETEKQIRKLIDIGLHEQEIIVESLKKLISYDNDSLKIMETIYDDYCNGFTFLR